MRNKKYTDNFYAIRSKQWENDFLGDEDEHLILEFEDDIRHENYESAEKRFKKIPNYRKIYYEIVEIEKITKVKTHKAWE
jgi:CRISPR/Cas system-associated protein Cas5 (RAMP superfamily)